MNIALKCFCFTTCILLSFSSAFADTTPIQAFDFKFPVDKGESFSLSTYRGKTVLLVNTSNNCGFTGQYAELQQLWDRYSHRGLVIVAVPSSDFSNSSNGTPLKRCKDSYPISFTITDPAAVTGEHSHPFYQWLATELGDTAVPHRDFYKYLINPNGKVVEWFPPQASVLSEQVMGAIERHLPPTYTLDLHR